jgi:hypothetical protein
VKFNIGDMCRVKARYARSSRHRVHGPGLIFDIDRGLYGAWLNDSTGARERQDRLHILWYDGVIDVEPHACVEPLPSEGE